MAAFQRVQEDELTSLVNTTELKTVKAFMRDKIETWRNIPLNVAVTGSSGQGKSSLINAILNLADKLDKRAAVGVTETTETIKPYTSSDNDQVVFWDLPGCGTQKFPRSTYLKDVEFDKFDFFIIVSAVRFTEDDIWLANQIILRNMRNFFFVRSKLDGDMLNDKRAHPKSHDPRQKMAEIRANVEENLGDLCSYADVFLVSSRRRNEFDFENMTNTLIEKSPSLKRESLVMSLNNVTDSVIKKKYDILRRNIGIVAQESSRRSIYPLERVDLKANLYVLACHIDMYRSQFGLAPFGIEAAREYVKGELKAKYEKATAAVKKSPSLEIHQATSYIMLKDHLDDAKNAASQHLHDSLHEDLARLSIEP